MGISMFVCSDHKGQAKNYKVPETVPIHMCCFVTTGSDFHSGSTPKDLQLPFQHISWVESLQFVEDLSSISALLVTTRASEMHPLWPHTSGLTLGSRSRTAFVRITMQQMLKLSFSDPPLADGLGADERCAPPHAQELGTLPVFSSLVFQQHCRHHHRRCRLQRTP